MRSTRLGHFLYTSSLFLLILLLGACVAISAADVIIQARSLRTPAGDFDFRNLTAVAASYFVLAALALSFSCSRVVKVRSALQNIPKNFVPIMQSDIPKKVYERLQKDFKQVKETRERAGPKAEDAHHPGWAIPGSSTFDGVNFKRAIAHTPFFIEKAATALNVHYARPPHITIRQYIEFLIRQGLIDAHLGHGYRVGYEHSRFRKAPISEERYLDIMKHLAAILRNMSYPLQSGIYLQDSDVLPAIHPGIRQGSPHDDDDVSSLAQSVATWASQSNSLSQHVWNSHLSAPSRIDRR